VATCPTQPSPGPGKRRASPRSSSDLLGPTASCLAAPVQQHFQHSRTRSPDRPPASFAVRTTKPLSKTAHNRLAPPYASPMVSSPLLCARASLESSPSRFDFALRLFANGANSVLGFGVDWFCLQNLGNRREMKLDEMPPEAATSALPQRSDRRALPPPPPPPPRRPPPPPSLAFNGRPGEERSSSAPKRQEEADAADTGRGVARPREALPRVLTGHNRLSPSYASLQAITGPQVGTPPSVRAHLARITFSPLRYRAAIVYEWC
jgi:hypothetical protein